MRTARVALTVGQIMSAGRPQMLHPDMPIRAADELMRRFGHEGFRLSPPTAHGQER